MAIEAAISEPCDQCKPELKKRCRIMPRGKELDLLNERIRISYPRVVTILSVALCEKCGHRGDHRGCKYGRLPVMECGLYGCKYFRQWGDWRPQPEKKLKEQRVISKN